MFIFIVIISLAPFSQCAFAGFINMTICTASYNQTTASYNQTVSDQEQACEESLDGIVNATSNAWATGPEIPPQNTIFDFAYYATLENMTIVISFERDKQFITKLKLEVDTNLKQNV